MILLDDLVAALDGLYPPSTAAAWDAVGPVCGDPTAPVHAVLLAVDPVDVVVDEALALGVQLVVTHHPLYLRGTSSVYGGTAKGRVVQRLLGAGCALYVAHTNADDAPDGVSAALAAALGVHDAVPLVPSSDPAARPGTGSGRVGDLPATVSLADFAATVARTLPRTPAGIRVAGDAARPVRRVAVCGGAGDAYLDVATAAGADVMVTADLRHHVVGEHLARGGPALVDPGHWASEWPWLPAAARALIAAVGEGTVAVHVSTRVTDPWSAHLAGSHEGPSDEGTPR